MFLLCLCLYLCLLILVVVLMMIVVVAFVGYGEVGICWLICNDVVSLCLYLLKDMWLNLLLGIKSVYYIFGAIIVIFMVLWLLVNKL